jgi:DNA-binding transcriptional regulator YiaG
MLKKSHPVVTKHFPATLSPAKLTLSPMCSQLAVASWSVLKAPHKPHVFGLNAVCETLSELFTSEDFFIAKKLTEQQRLAIIAKWRASGLSISKFAVVYKCNVHNLMSWFQRRQRDPEKQTEQHFVKLKLPESSMAAAAKRARFHRSQRHSFKNRRELQAASSCCRNVFGCGAHAMKGIQG